MAGQRLCWPAPFGLLSPEGQEEQLLHYMKKYIHDPLVRATLRAQAKTSVGRLASLLATEAKWNRKATIARNQVAKARKAIARMAQDMATKLLREELT